MVVKKFNSINLSWVRKLIEQEQKEFEVYLDEVRIIQRTEDTNKLNDISDFLSPESESIKVKIFRGASNHSDVVFLQIQNDLKGIEQQKNVIDEPKLSEEELREKIRKEILSEMRTKTETERLKDRIAELESELEEAKSIKSYVPAVINGLGSFLGTNKALVKQFPILGALSGVPLEDNEQPAPSEESAEKAVYKPKNMVKVPQEHKETIEIFLEKCQEDPRLFAFIHAPLAMDEESLENIIFQIINQ